MVQSGEFKKIMYEAMEDSQNPDRNARYRASLKDNIRQLMVSSISERVDDIVDNILTTAMKKYNLGDGNGQ